MFAVLLGARRVIHPCLVPSSALYAAHCPAIQTNEHALNQIIMLHELSSFKSKGRALTLLPACAGLLPVCHRVKHHPSRNFLKAFKAKGACSKGVEMTRFLQADSREWFIIYKCLDVFSALLKRLQWKTNAQNDIKVPSKLQQHWR